jgi:hypothetical protein
VFFTNFCELNPFVGDKSAHTFIGECFQQHRMGHPAIDYVRAGHSGFYRIEGTTDFRQHASADGSVRNEFINLAGEDGFLLEDVMHKLNLVG